MKRETLENALQVQYAINDRVSLRGVKGYLQNVVIDSRPEPKTFGKVADKWQWEVYGPIATAIEKTAGFRNGYTGPLSFWRGLPRGCDKTSMIARLLNWVVGYSKKRLSVSVAAGDSDQAKFVTDAMEAECNLNPWLGRRVTITQKKITGPGGRVRVLTADAPTSYGLTDDIIICDEITNWKKPDLWQAIITGREKRPGAVLAIISNAGTLGSWQWSLLQEAKSRPESWDVFEAPVSVHLASWMTPEKIKELRALVPRGLARRVFDNKWIDPAEESDFLTRAEIEGCEAKGKEMGLHYKERGEHGIRYVASIDYGPRRDRTALSVGHLDEQGRVVVDRLDVWQGSPEEPVLIAKVEEWIENVNTHFNLPDLVVDTYQLEGTVQKYEFNQTVERFEARGGKSNYEMAENLRSLVSSGLIVWYPGAGGLPVGNRIESLVDEMLSLVLKTTPYGYRFDHTASFHDDRTVSVGMLALHLLRQDPSGPGVSAPPLSTTPLPIPLVSRVLARKPKRGLYGTNIHH